MKSPRVVLMVIGAILVAIGLLWTLQGFGIVGGSAMSGVALWAIIGPLVIVGGIVLVVRSRR